MKKILAGILVLTVFLGGCGGSKASKSPELVREAFGTTFSEVKENFGWEMEKNQMKEQIEPYYEEERVVGYSMELEDVELLGTNASRVFLQFMGEEREKAELVLIYAEFPSEKEVDVAAKKLTKAFGEKKSEMYCSLPGFSYWGDIWEGRTYVEELPNLEKVVGDDGTELWGTEETVKDALKDAGNPEEAYRSWGLTSNTYIWSIEENGWEAVKQDPLVKAVLFRNSEKYKKQNVLFIDGFNQYMADMEK